MDLALNNVGQALTAGQNDPSPPASPLPFLLPGEVVKFSGKYNNTSSAPVTQAKNTVKDEVVIRNADSGKGIHNFLCRLTYLHIMVSQNGYSAPFASDGYQGKAGALDRGNKRHSDIISARYSNIICLSIEMFETSQIAK